MNFSKYDRRIAIEQKSTTRDPNTNRQVITWVPFATVWAEVQDVLPGKSAEFVPQGIRIERRPARIRIRYLAGVTSDMRIVVAGAARRTMQIVSGPAEIGRHEAMELMCEEFTTAANQ